MSKSIFTDTVDRNEYFLSPSLLSLPPLPPLPPSCSKTKGLEREQRLVYQLIEDSGNKGIWMREIRFRSGAARKFRILHFEYNLLVTLVVF